MLRGLHPVYRAAQKFIYSEQFSEVRRGALEFTKDLIQARDRKESKNKKSIRSV